MGRDHHGRVRDGRCVLGVGRVVRDHRIDVGRDHHGRVRDGLHDLGEGRVVRDRHDLGSLSHRDCGCAGVVHHDLDLGDFVHDVLQGLASHDVDAHQVRSRSRFHHRR